MQQERGLRCDTMWQNQLVPCTRGLRAGSKSSVISTEMQEVSIMPLKSCPALCREAEEAPARPTGNNSHLAASAPG